MPNLPTSLILVLLALAWLVVLVPMFARSREAVPETDDGTAGFRVLQRTGARLRGSGRTSRRSSRRETADLTDDLDDRGDRHDRVERHDPTATGDDELVGELVDINDINDINDIDDIDDIDENDLGDEGDLGDEDDIDEDSRLVDDKYRTTEIDRQGDAADEWQREHRTVAATHSRPSGRPSPRGSAEFEDTSERGDGRRPAAHRPGRGGFDPEHAAATAAYRFRRRRIVTLVLLLIAGVLVAGAKLVNGSLWIGVVVTGLVLAGYLTYLNRTVRIERAIADRRMARLRRAQEIRPTAAREAGPRSPYRHPGEEAPGSGPTERLARAHVPGPSRRAGVVVDLDDDDPAFDDLEYFEPVVYRRAAGQ